MRPYLLEECHEVLEALDRGDLASLREELGDLLFQVYFLARLAEEAGAFDVEDAARSVVEKMVVRHPHVWPDASMVLGAEGGISPPSATPPPVTTNDAAAVGSLAAWEARKAATRKGSRVDGVPAALPALLHAHRVAEKVSHVGFDWPDVAGVLAKVDEERAELAGAIAAGDPDAIRHEYGDLLLACANLGRFLGVGGEDALREANARFERRFRGVEARAAAAGVTLEAAGLARLEGWWAEEKHAE